MSITIPKFTKKPVEIEAHQWFKNGDHPKGGHIVCPGDWIIQGIEGEFYPCKPDIFEKTYDYVGE